MSSWWPTGGNSGDSLASILPSGFYLRPATMVSNPAGVSMSVGVLTAIPFVLAASRSIVGIGARPSTAGATGCVVRLGLYAAADDGSPGSLILDAGTIDGTSASQQIITIAETLRGLVWGAAVVQSQTCSMSCLALGGNLGVPDTAGTVVGSRTQPGYKSATSVTGALPASFGTPTPVDQPIEMTLVLA